MKKDILYLHYHTLAPQMQGTKCNRSYRTLKIQKKQVQESKKFNARVSRSVKGPRFAKNMRH